MGASLLALAKSIYYVYRMLRPVISQQGFFFQSNNYYL